VRGRIEMILDDATNRFRSGDNPARWTKAMQHSLGRRPKSGQTRGAMASVPPDDIPALMVRLRERKHPTARAVYAIILSCLRSQEFVQMRRRELDLDTAQPTWMIPYARFKVDPHKQDFKLPLSTQLVDILREQIAELEDIYGAENVDYIWPASTQGTRDGGSQNPHISDATMRKYLQESMGCEATVHGFRASLQTWTDDQFADGSDVTPKYHPHAVDFCLAHVAPGGNTRAAYRRGMMFKARIVIMRDWANHCVPRPLVAANDNVPAAERAANNADLG
jgi:integrase